MVTTTVTLKQVLNHTKSVIHDVYIPYLYREDFNTKDALFCLEYDLKSYLRFLSSVENKKHV